MEKSEALRLADLIRSRHGNEVNDEAAAELRRLHEDNNQLRAQRDVLLEACKAYDKWADKTFCYDRELRPIRAQIRAAIKAVEGEGK